MHRHHIGRILVAAGLIAAFGCSSELPDREATIAGTVKLPAGALTPPTQVEVSCPDASIDLVFPTDSTGGFLINFFVSGSVARDENLLPCRLASPSTHAPRSAADAQVVLWDPAGPHGANFVTLLPLP